jgi:ATP-dependent HslUV protease, peptidase subunit HslV
MAALSFSPLKNSLLMSSIGRLSRQLISRSYYGGAASKNMNSENNYSVLGGEFHATTILSVRKGNKVVVIGDGQVTRGSEIVKMNAVKVRRLGGSGHEIISGFAGSTADCLALRERLEAKIDAYSGQLARAAVELAKEWRTEKYLRRLEAVMIVVDKTTSLQITGNGDVIEPTDGIMAIGSGGSYALAAARALMDTDLDAMTIAEKAMNIASDMCVYTNKSFVKDYLEIDPVSENNNHTKLN